jgi:LemA protein
MWEVLVLLLVVGGGVAVYNSLVKLKNQAENAWSDIDVQLKRRHDLIPNLVETVRGYATHEQRTLQVVIDARSQAVTAAGPAERGRAEATLTGALGSVFALAEAYPELRASDGFRQLHTSLSRLEEDISQARRYYNAVVRDYNTRIGQVPTNVVAKAFRFQEREFFQIDREERAAPTVRLAGE